MQSVFVINYYEKDRYGRLNKLNDLLAHGWRILSQCAAGDRISYVLENSDYDIETYYKEHSIHEM